jgi:hypothetical protein
VTQIQLRDFHVANGDCKHDLVTAVWAAG